jgi:3-hydroxybutyryl-CoA dehydrogenase
MTKAPNAPDYTVGVVGAGVMGRGIAQILAAGGTHVMLFDTRDGAAEEAREFAGRMIQRAVEKGAITAEEAKHATGRLKVAGSLAAFGSADLVVEAIVENMDAKRALIAELEGIVGEGCILASNTSSLSVTSIAAGARKPERIAGWHFFNPVPLMKVVEVVDGVLTAPWVAETLANLARRAGHEPVRAKDSPGFLVNHAGRGLNTEGVRIVSEGIADFAAVDDLLREGGPGFRMGPFELMDVTGLDVSHPVMESIYRQFYDEPRFRPHPITRIRMEAGLIGRKVGRGFYVYQDGRKVAPPAAPAPADLPGKVWISNAEPEGRARLLAAVGNRVAVDDGGKPSPSSVCLFAPLGMDATSAAVGEGVEAERAFAVDTLFGLDGRRTLMTTPVSDPELRDQVHALLAADGKAVTVIGDSPGFVNQRVVATVVNIACEIAQQRIASPEDIDKAVRLGLGYPRGPLAMGDAAGPRRLLKVLDAMAAFYGDPRYRPSPWLKRRALLGVSLATPER